MLHYSVVLFFYTVVTKDSCNWLQLRTFVKPTDYLHFSSHHIAQLCNNIPYGPFLRLHRNPSSFVDFCHDIMRLSKQFRDRGYPDGIVSKARSRALQIDCKSLFQSKPAQQAEHIHCSFEFSYAISRLIKKHWHIVKHLPQCDIPPVVGFKKTRSIGDLVTRSDIFCFTSQKICGGHFKCGHCKACRFSLQLQFCHPSLNLPVQLRARTTCKSHDIIYVTLCLCQKLYVGLSRCPAKVRILEHVARIRN